MAGEAGALTSAAEINWSVVFGFIITGLISMLAWFYVRDADRKEKKEDKREADREALETRLAQERAEDQKNFDLKLEKLATLMANQFGESAKVFGQKVEMVGNQFMGEVREMKIALDTMSKELTRLASMMVQVEKDGTTRYEATNKRIDDFLAEMHKTLDQHWDEIKKIRDWKHPTDVLIQGFIAKLELQERTALAVEKETNLFRTDSTGRLKAIEEKVSTMHDFLKVLEASTSKPGRKRLS